MLNALSFLLLAALILSPTIASSPSLLGAIVPEGTLTHFCIVTSWDSYNTSLINYGTLFGTTPPAPGIAGGIDSNGTYVNKGVPEKLTGSTKIAFMGLNNRTNMEFLAGDPDHPSWWRDVYLAKGYEVHHQGYMLPKGESVWPVVQALSAAGLGEAVQWGRWGDINQPGSGCYVYCDTQMSLGVTIEILGGDAGECDSLPAQPKA